MSAWIDDSSWQFEYECRLLEAYDQYEKDLLKWEMLMTIEEFEEENRQWILKSL